MTNWRKVTIYNLAKGLVSLINEELYMVSLQLSWARNIRVVHFTSETSLSWLCLLCRISHMVVVSNRTYTFIIWITFECSYTFRILSLRQNHLLANWTENHLIAKVISTARFYANWPGDSDFKNKFICLIPKSM